MIITIYAKHGKREALRKQIIDLGTGCDVRNADGAARFAALRMTCSTDECIARSPITREDAVEILKPLHQQAAMQINGEHV